MNQEVLASSLLNEWERPDGFFAKLREGDFDDKGALRVLHYLGQLDLQSDESLELALYRQLWYMPLFCQWQEERMRDRSKDTTGVHRFGVDLLNILQDKIGVP